MQKRMKCIHCEIANKRSLPVSAYNVRGEGLERQQQNEPYELLSQQQYLIRLVQSPSTPLPISPIPQTYWLHLRPQKSHTPLEHVAFPTIINIRPVWEAGEGYMTHSSTFASVLFETTNTDLSIIKCSCILQPCSPFKRDIGRIIATPIIDN